MGALTIRNWLVIGMLVLVAGCSSGGPNDEAGEVRQDEKLAGPGRSNTVVVGMPGEPQTFNPDARPDDYFYAPAQNIYSRLIKLNNNQEIIPDLARSWTVSKDGKEITFELQEGVVWHDGQPFTSQDVKFTLDSIMEQKGAAVDNLSSLQSVRTPDPHTAILTLKHPDATFLGYLAWYATFIMPEHIYQGEQWDSGTRISPIGTGPFKFKEYTPGVKLILERNEQYFGQIPSVDRLVFSIMPDPNTMVQAFYNGELDIFGTDPPITEVTRMEERGDINITKKVFPSRYYLVFNTAKPPFDQPEVRQAIAYALNNEEIVNKAMKGQGQASSSFLSPVYAWALSERYKLPEYDPAKAHRMLEQAGLKPDAEGNYLTISFKLFQDGTFSDMAMVIKDQLQQAGIHVQIEVKEYAAWQEEVVQGRNYDMSMLGGYQGPDVGAIANRVSTSGSNNIMGYSNAKLDEALQQAALLTAPTARKVHYEEVQRILSDDMPIYPVSEWISMNPVHEYVKGDPASAEAVGYTGFSEYNYVRMIQD
ncbi:ABC transporter substrate-binding protein [Paenibacillus massiliensis]|uniref:ABC transporter substrate-binding protein n=1 Tax=Paenibacillus massiliensis TaxID=225917 RepID=UPI0003758C40|nr:ABC transporter substrate-binding protein [Paenibacillus massiliensis]